MIAAELSYTAPATIEEAVDALAGDGYATVLAGGMSLVPSMNVNSVAPTSLVSLRRISALRSIEAGVSSTIIGAMTRHHDLATSEVIRSRFSALADAAAAIGDRQVRNRGTIGGSLSQAEQNADLIPPLLVLGARVVLRSRQGEREVPVERFILGERATDRRPDELLIAVHVPPPPAGTTTGHARFAPSAGAGPLVTAAALVAPGTAVVAVGGPCPPVMVQLRDTERETVEELVGASAAVDDPWMSHMMRVVAWRAIEKGLTR